MLENCANIWGYYSLMLGRYSQILGVASSFPKLAKLANSFRFVWASTDKEADAGDMKNIDILLLLSLEFWFYWSKVRPYQKFGPTLVPTIQTSCNVLPLAFDSRRRHFKQSGTHGGWRGAHRHLPPTLPSRAVDFWKGRRSQQFCQGASGLCMCACRFFDLIGSFRKNPLSKQQSSERLQRCVLHLHFCFKTISWWRCFFPVWIVQLPIRHYTIGKEIVDLVLDRIRKLADNCTGQQTASSVRFFVVLWNCNHSCSWMLMR